MRKYLLITIMSFVLLGMCSCSNEKIKENREKYEQQKFEKEFEMAMIIASPLLEALLSEMTDCDLNVTTETLPNKTSKFTIECIFGENEEYDGTWNDSEKENLKKRLVSIFEDELRNGHSVIFNVIIKQGGKIIDSFETKLTQEDLHEVNVTFKK